MKNEMRRALAMAAVCAVLVSGGMSLTASADTLNGKTVSAAEASGYHIDETSVESYGDGTCRLKKLDVTSENVVIPSEVDGMKVITIGEGAFIFNDVIKTVTIPEGVTLIEENAFSNCNELTEVKLPSTVEVIEDKAFYGCPKLSKVNFPENVMYIGFISFAGSSLQNVTIPSKLCVIGGSAFKDCTKLETIVLPSQMTQIPDLMCYNCTSLKSVTIPDSVSTVMESAFRGCSSLEEITVPPTVNAIAAEAFGYDLNGGKIPGFTMNVTAGSIAERYARENDISYAYAGGNAGTKGDINLDGMITVTDISMTAAHVKGVKSLDDAAVTRADVNGDGMVTVTDISKIAAHVKGVKTL